MQGLEIHKHSQLARIPGVGKLKLLCQASISALLLLQSFSEDTEQTWRGERACSTLRSQCSHNEIQKSASL